MLFYKVTKKEKSYLVLAESFKDAAQKVFRTRNVQRLKKSPNGATRLLVNHSIVTIQPAKGNFKNVKRIF